MRKTRSIARTILSLLGTRPGLAALAFLAVGGTIAANALYWQSASHPAPLFATRDVAAPPADAPLADAPGAALQKGDMIVAAVQSALAGDGYYDGPVDGVPGPRTREAILSFERASGLPETGAASPDLLAAAQAAAGEEQGDAQPVSHVAAADPSVLLVQEALSEAAYGPLAVDGVLGDETRQAILRFQKDQGMNATGEIDDLLVQRLRAVGALGGT